MKLSSSSLRRPHHLEAFSSHSAAAEGSGSALIGLQHKDTGDGFQTHVVMTAPVMQPRGEQPGSGTRQNKSHSRVHWESVEICCSSASFFFLFFFEWIQNLNDHIILFIYSRTVGENEWSVWWCREENRQSVTERFLTGGGCMPVLIRKDLFLYVDSRSAEVKKQWMDHNNAHYRDSFIFRCLFYLWDSAVEDNLDWYEV